MCHSDLLCARVMAGSTFAEFYFGVRLLRLFNLLLHSLMIVVFFLFVSVYTPT